jgi:hypothetical protein
MRIYIDIHVGRRHLRFVPPLVATIVALVFIEWPVTLWAPLIVLAAWLLTGFLIAIGDEAICRYRDWSYERQLIKSIDNHPTSTARKSPKHAMAA